MGDLDQAGLGWTVVLRRQPVRVVAGRAEGGYTDVYELVCCDCGDHPDLDYREVSPELQQIRGPYPFAAGIAAYQKHVQRRHSPQAAVAWLARPLYGRDGSWLWQLRPRTWMPSARHRCGAGT